MAKYILTGAAGFIGSRAAQILCDQGNEVIGIDCFLDLLYPNQPKLDRIQQLKKNPTFTFQKLDLSEEKVDQLLDSTDAVLHFAALAGLATSFAHPQKYLKHNLLATQNLVASLKNTNTHLVHASTSSVYGKFAIGDESANLKPVSPYGESKLKAEQAADQTNSTILRYFSVYGPGQRPEMAYARAIQAALNDEKFTIFGDGTQRRTNTYVDDAANAAILAAKSKTTGIFNISGNESITLNDALDLIEQLTDKHINRNYQPETQGDQKETKGYATKANTLLNWHPATNFKTGIALQIESQKNNAS